MIWFRLIYALREPKILQALQYCSSELFLNRTYLKWRTGYSYPQNVLRNLARQASITHYTLSLGEHSISRIKYTQLQKEPQRMLQSWSFPQTWTSCPALVLPHPWPAFWLATPAPSGKKWKNCFEFWVCLWLGTILMNKFVFILFFVTRCAFVLPTYEIHEAAALPQDKSQLAELVKRLFAKYKKK